MDEKYEVPKEIRELHEAVEKHVLLIGEQFGYGFLIRVLRRAWMKHLQEDLGFSYEDAKEATDMY